MLKILLISLFVFSYSFTSPVDIESANLVSKNVFNQFNLEKRFEYNVKDVEIISEGGIDLIYIYHLNPIGFILISADNRSEPYLGYSFNSNFKTDNMPSNFNFFFNNLKNIVKHPILTNSVQSIDIKDAWTSLNSNEYRNEEVRNVSPLISAEFDQSGSWNNALSAFGFYGPVGCVAVAMSQIMYYWGYPEQGVGSNTYIEDNYGSLTADFSTAFYDFDSMAPTYATSASQLLLYHTGISVNMDYDNGGSGAQVEGVYPSAEDAFQRYFKYSDDIRSIEKDNYEDDNEYRSILKEELNNNRPILHSGFDNSDYGHAWNIDGYQNNNMHCNWGWGGWNNGYFSVNSMNGMPNYQTSLTKVIPDLYTSPLALFAYEVVDNTVIFIDISSEINESELNTWNWDFGDGITETNSNGFAEHTYSSNGEYTINLTVSNIYGYTGLAHSETITIGNVLQGDINSDELINVLDIVMLVNFILNDDTVSDSDFNNSDLNNDNLLNVLDLVSLVNIILTP